VNVFGLHLFCTIIAANISDIHPGRSFISDLANLPRLEKVLVDKAYQGMGGNYDNLNAEISSKNPEHVAYISIHKK